MMVIELRKAAQDKAFELLDEIEDLGYQKKMVLCELKDVLYECFESSEEEYENYEKEPELDFRRRGQYRYSMRNGMKNRDYDDYEDMQMRRGMRMRSGRRAA